MKAAAADAIHPSSEAVAAKAFKIISAVLVIALVFSAIICAIHTIRVTDGKETYVKTTVFETPEAIAHKVAAGHDYEVKSITPGLYCTDVVISYSFPLTVTIGDRTEAYTASSGVLKDILSSLGIMIDEYDIVTPSCDTVITEACLVDIVDIEYKTEISTEAIPYENTLKYSDSHYTTTRKTLVAGVDGSKVVTSSVMYINGVRSDATVIDEQVVSSPVNAETLVGTKTAPKNKTVSTLKAPASLELDENGVPVNYKSVSTLRATAYTHTGFNCSTGVKPQPGYVAVDPKEIPYGTEMYIVSADGRYVYGYAIAADTGGFTKGNRTDMDLFMDTKNQCINFGRRDIIVYFL